MAKRSKNRSKKINSSDLYPIAVIFALYAMVYKDSALQILTFVASIGAIAALLFILYKVLLDTKKQDAYNPNYKAYQIKTKSPGLTNKVQSQNNRLGYSSTSVPVPQERYIPDPPSAHFLERKVTINPKPTYWSRELINEIEWKVFEDLCAEYYKMQGLIAKTTGFGADGGVDIYLFDEDVTAQKKLVGIVQCKAWNKYKVGVDKVRALYGVMARKNADFAVFITSGYFTKDAIREYSGGNKMELVDGDKLYANIRSLVQEDQDLLLRNITSGDYTTPTCPTHGTKMISRPHRHGSPSYWGCINSRCNYRLKKRAS